MASSNKAPASLKLGIDLDLEPGKVEAKALAAEIDKQLKGLLKKVQSSTKLPLDYQFDQKGFAQQIAKAKGIIDKEVNALLKTLGTSLETGTKNNLALAVKKKLKETTDVLDKDGKIVGAKLRELLTLVAKETGNASGLGPRGKSPLKAFLDLEGKTLRQATTQLTAEAAEYKKAVQEVLAAGEDAIAKSKVGKVAQTLKQVGDVVNVRKKATLDQIKASELALSGLDNRTAVAREAFEFTRGEGAASVGDSGRIKALNTYTSALINQIAQLRLAQQSGKEMAISEDQVQEKLAKLGQELKRVSPELFKLSQNLKDSLKGTPEAYQLLTQQVGALNKAQLKVNETTFRAGQRDEGTKQAVEALQKQRAAVQELLDLRKQVDGTAKTDTFKTQIADGDLLIKQLDRQILRNQELVRAENERLANLRRARKEDVEGPAKEAERRRKEAEKLEAELIQKAGKSGEEARKQTLKLVEEARKQEDAAKKRAAAADRQADEAENRKAKADADRIKRKAEAQAALRQPDVILKGREEDVSKAQHAVENARQLADTARQYNSSFKEQLSTKQQLLRAEERYIQALIALESQQKKMGVSTAGTNRLLKEQKAVISTLTSEMSNLDNIFVQSGRSLQLFFRYAVLYTIMYKVADSIRTAIASIIDLQAALISIKAVAGATNQEMIGITASVQDVAQTTAFSVLDVAQAGQTLVQAGVQIKDFNTVLRATADLASSTGSSMSETSDILTTFLEVFKDADPGELADKLRNAVNISKLSVSDLRTISNFLLETSESFNLSVDSVTAAAATLRNAGIKASTIGTGLRQGLLELFKPDKKTVEGLQKQYASIGQNLSQDTIRAMFAGFANAKDPLLAVLNELEKIGVGGVGENQFTRVLDIRAENVVKTLLANKDAYIANTVAIKETGTAAEGTKIQMESLQASFQNLTETLTNTLFSAFEGTLRQITKVVKNATALLDQFKHSLNELRAGTGDTGVGGATQSGIATTLTLLLKQFTIGKALVYGLLVGIAQEVSTVFGATNKTVKNFATAVEVITTALLAQAGISILVGKAKAVAKAKGAGKVASAVGPDGVILAEETVSTLATLSQLAKDKIGGITSKAKAVAGIILGYATSATKLWEGIKVASTLIVTRLAPWSLAIYGLYEGINYVIDKTDIFGNKQRIEEEKAKALAALGIENQKAQEAFDALKASAEEEAKQVQSFKDTISKANSALDVYLNDANKDKITELFKVASDEVVAVGSQALEDVAIELEKSAGLAKGAVDRNQLASDLQKYNTAVQEAEGVRKVLLGDLKKAFSNQQAGSLSEQEKLLLDAFGKLTDKERSLIYTRTQDIEQANKLLELKGSKLSLTEFVKTSQKELKGDKLEDKKKEIEQFFKAFQVDPLGIQGPSYARLQAETFSAIEDGQTQLVEAILSITKEGKLFSPSILADAAKNKANLGLEKFQKALTLSQNEVPINRKLPTAENFEQDFAKSLEDRKKANEHAAQLKEGQKKVVEQEQKSLQDFIRYTQKEVADGNVTDARLEDLKKQLITHQERLVRAKDLLASSAVEEETTEQKLEAAQRQSLVGELEVKNLKGRLATLHNTKVHSTEDEVKLIQEIYEIQKKQLASEKELLAVALRKQVDKEALFDTKDVGPEGLLKALSGDVGRQALAGSKDLADAYKALSEVVGKEKTLREESIADLENAQRKELDSKLQDTNKKLTEQKSRTLSLENNLQNASSRLQSAREKLASLYEKQAELEDFFNKSLREISGEKLTVSDIQDTITAAGASGSVELAKGAVSDIKDLLSSGGISKDEALSLTEQARDTALAINSQEINQQSNFVSNLTDEVNSLNSSLLFSRYAEQELTDAVNNLTTTLEKLKETLANGFPGGTPTGGTNKAETAQDRASGGEENNPTLNDSQVSDLADKLRKKNEQPQDTTLIGYAQGGLVQGPGGPTEDKVPLWGSDGEYMQPASAVNLYGKDFMDKLRTLQLDPEVAQRISKPSSPGLARPDRTVTQTLQPVIIDVGGATLTAMAEPDQVPSFQSQVRLQRLKTGSRK